MAEVREPIRVLHIIDSVCLKAGGPAAALGSIIQTCQAAGVESAILTLDHGNCHTNVPDEIVNKVAFSFPSRFSKSREGVAWIEARGRSYDFAAIYGVWSFFCQDSARALKSIGVPYSVRPCGSLDPFDLQKKAAAKRAIGQLVVRRTLEEAAYVHCSAALEAERLETYGGKPKIKVAPLPVPTAPQAGDGARFREKCGFSADDFVVLFLSRVDYKKGLNLLIPAVAQVAANHPQLKVALAGPDSHGYLAKVEGWIDEFGVRDRVQVLGMITGQDKADAFAGSNLFALPSMNENFGVAVVEALAYGVPALISSNVYIWRDVEEAAFVCDYSEDSVAKTLANAIEQPGELLHRAERSKDVAARFSPTALAEQYRNLYLEGMGR